MERESHNYFIPGFAARLDKIFGDASHNKIAKDLGVSRSIITDWYLFEKIGTRHLMKICVNYNVSADWLLFGIGTEPERCERIKNIELISRRGEVRKNRIKREAEYGIS